MAHRCFTTILHVNQLGRGSGYSSHVEGRWCAARCRGLLSGYTFGISRIKACFHSSVVGVRSTVHAPIFGTERSCQCVFRRDRRRGAVVLVVSPLPFFAQEIFMRLRYWLIQDLLAMKNNFWHGRSSERVILIIRTTTAVLVDGVHVDENINLDFLEIVNRFHDARAVQFQLMHFAITDFSRQLGSSVFHIRLFCLDRTMYRKDLRFECLNVLLDLVDAFAKLVQGRRLCGLYRLLRLCFSGDKKACLLSRTSWTIAFRRNWVSSLQTPSRARLASSFAVVGTLLTRLSWSECLRRFLWRRWSIVQFLYYTSFHGGRRFCRGQPHQWRIARVLPVSPILLLRLFLIWRKFVSDPRRVMDRSIMVCLFA